MQKLKVKQHAKNPLFIIGIDEVGRGSLAGPVFVCAVALKSKMQIEKFLPHIPFKDSKKLSPRLREQWFQKAKEKSIPFVFSHVTPKVIDRINISSAANLGAQRSLKKLEKKFNIPLQKSLILLDGGLKVKNGTSIIKGDEKIPAIKLASILAKVKRDQLMRKKSKIYPQYYFEKNKGYGTKVHITMVKKYGLTPLHRKTFCKFIM